MRPSFSSPRTDAPILRKQMPELDSIRGLAIILVFLFHAYASEVRPSMFHGAGRWVVQACRAGWTGVNLFFVLSGFLITGILFESKKSSNYWRKFYARRALRILPAYYLLLLLLPLAALIPTMPEKVGWSFVAFSFAYLANISEFFGVQLQYGPLWSLAVEEHFYIAWPWIVRWLTLRGIAIAATAIVLVSPLIRSFTFRVGGAWNGSVRTWNSLDGLAMGALLAVALRSNLPDRKVVRRFLRSSFLLSLVVLVVGYHHGILSDNSDALGKALRPTAVNLIALAFVSATMLVGTGPLKRLVVPPVLQFLGFISYGFYLIHVLALHLYDAIVGPVSADLTRLTIRAAVVFAAAVGICWLSRTTFEQYFLKLKNRFDGTQTKKTTQAVSAAS